MCEESSNPPTKKDVATVSKQVDWLSQFCDQLVEHSQHRALQERGSTKKKGASSPPKQKPRSSPRHKQKPQIQEEFKEQVKAAANSLALESPTALTCVDLMTPSGMVLDVDELLKLVDGVQDKSVVDCVTEMLSTPRMGPAVPISPLGMGESPLAALFASITDDMGDMPPPPKRPRSTRAKPNLVASSSSSVGSSSVNTSNGSNSSSSGGKNGQSSKIRRPVGATDLVIDGSSAQEAPNSAVSGVGISPSSMMSPLDPSPGMGTMTPGDFMNLDMMFGNSPRSTRS